MAAVREDRKLSSARVWIGHLGSQLRREASGTVAVLCGTLTQGTNDMVAKIADAIAAKMAVPMVSR